MAKFLVVGDIHYRGTNPRARLDDFREAIWTKIEEVLEIAKHNKVDAILQSGDIFDSPGVGYSITGEVAHLLPQAGIPWYCVAGNHDEFGANVEGLGRTPLWLLHRLEIVTILDSEPDIVFYDGTKQREIFVTGKSYCHETDSNPEWYSIDPRIRESFNNCLTINVVHGMLLDKPFGFDMKHQIIDNIPNPADITIVGHEHTGFGAICRPDGKWFINPGALCRLSASVAEIERTVQVALLEITERDITVKMIPIQSARPGSEVLSREHIEEAKQRDERLETFLRLLASEGEAKYMEVQEIVEDLAAREKLPPGVVKEALERIGKAREIISGRTS